MIAKGGGGGGGEQEANKVSSSSNYSSFYYFTIALVNVAVQQSFADHLKKVIRSMLTL